VSTRTHTQSEENDPENEGTKAEGKNGREEEGQALQRYSAYDPRKVRMESEEEDQYAHTQSL
jgi:hypothetical protein